MRRLVLIALAVAAVAAPVAHAYRLPAKFGPMANNPADRFLKVPIDPVEYDAAKRCDPKEKPGVVAFTAWLQRNAQGVFWGSYRCERRGEAWTRGGRVRPRRVAARREAAAGPR